MAVLSREIKDWGRYVVREYDAAQVLRAEADLTSTTTLTPTDNLGGLGTGGLVIAIRGSVTGTSPTLDVVLQGSDDGQTWYDIASFPQITGAGEYLVPFVNPFTQFRVVLTVGGTSPSFGATEVYLVRL